MSARYLKPLRVTLTEHQSSDGVEAGDYEVHPDGSWRRVRVYRRFVSRSVVARPAKQAPDRRDWSIPQLRRVKHAPTIRAVLAKLESEREEEP